MNKYTLIAALILGVFTCLSAQNRLKYEYCQANVSTGYFNSIVQLDAEGAIPFKLNWNKYIIDENGKYFKVKSAAEFINIMSHYDWEFVDFFPSNEGNSCVNILFKKELVAKAKVLDSVPVTKEGG